MPERNVFLGLQSSQGVKCGCVEDARQVFNEMSWHDSVSWSALIVGYVQNGHVDETLRLYYQMEADDVRPDFATMVSVIPACAYLGYLQLGKCIHCYVIKSTEFVHDMFEKMAERNVISWNAMINGNVKWVSKQGFSAL
jgi:pentatricopeptide repeat protein